LALLVQVGAIPGPPGACSIIGNCSIGFETHHAQPVWHPFGSFKPIAVRILDELFMPAGVDEARQKELPE